MAFPRVKLGGWALLEKLTSSQVTQLDTNVSNAFDIRASQTNSIASVSSFTGAGRLLKSLAYGPNSSVTITAGTASGYRVTALTADRVYALSNTGALLSDEITFVIDSGVAGYNVSIRNAADEEIFLLGNTDTADGAAVTVYFDGTAWRALTAASGRLRAITFTSNGTFAIPRGVTELLVSGCGGGGGGGAGAAGGGMDYVSHGGGGGGGPQEMLLRYKLVGSGNCAVTIGARGAGGATSSAPGSNGGTSYVAQSGNVFVAAFVGGGGGLASNGPVPRAYHHNRVVPGGGPVRNPAMGTSGSASGNEPLPFGMGDQGGTPGIGWVRVPGEGGAGTCAGSIYVASSGLAMPSQASVVLAVPNVSGGTIPSYNGGYYGGGAGGGGGGGGGGNGSTAAASGGDGGAPNPSGVGGKGGDGTYAIVNSAMGGGGGGGGGSGSGGGGAGGAGGSGGSGFVTIMWVK